ncbi:MAG: hypothetical protein ACRD00_05890 [Thermoanaerobaculia bacterium]
MTSRRALSALCFLAFALPALAQRPAGSPAPAAAASGSDEAKPAEKKAADEKPAKEEKPVVTKHSITVAGKPVGYTATAGYMPMKDEAGKLKANIFFVAFLPSYTATAWYHKRLPADLQSGPLTKATAEPEQFAMTEYNLALMRGSELPAAERQTIIIRRMGCV